MVDDDIDECFKKKWIEVLNLYNDNSMSDLIKSLETEQNIVYTLKHRGKFYFVMGKYEEAIADLTKLLELEPNNAFALRYRGETYHVMGKYEESIADLNKLLEINSNDAWSLNAREEVTRK